MTKRQQKAAKPQQGAVAQSSELTKPQQGAAETELTISIPEAGKRYFGLSRNGSYNAAAAGKIPTVQAGVKLRRVPVRRMEQILDGK